MYKNDKQLECMSNGNRTRPYIFGQFPFRRFFTPLFLSLQTASVIMAEIYFVGLDLQEGYGTNEGLPR